jgi:hypothetical protein
MPLTDRKHAYRATWCCQLALHAHCSLALTFMSCHFFCLLLKRSSSPLRFSSCATSGGKFATSSSLMRSACSSSWKGEGDLDRRLCSGESLLSAKPTPERCRSWRAADAALLLLVLPLGSALELLSAAGSAVGLYGSPLTLRGLQGG